VTDRLHGNWKKIFTFCPIEGTIGHDESITIYRKNSMNLADLTTLGLLLAPGLLLSIIVMVTFAAGG
jgi:hypothetical protein